MPTRTSGEVHTECSGFTIGSLDLRRDPRESGGSYNLPQTEVHCLVCSDAPVAFLTIELRGPYDEAIDTLWPGRDSLHVGHGDIGVVCNSCGLMAAKASKLRQPRRPHRHLAFGSLRYRA
jgi:hypothetical protein